MKQSTGRYINIPKTNSKNSEKKARKKTPKKMRIRKKKQQRKLRIRNLTIDRKPTPGMAQKLKRVNQKTANSQFSMPGIVKVCPVQFKPADA